MHAIVDTLELARTYAAARYGATVQGQPIALHVGVPAVELERAWPSERYAFLTAWNPASQPQSRKANDRADEALRARLDEAGVARVGAWAEASDGGWYEPGWLAHGLSLETLDALAREFGQAGTLSWMHGEPVHLRMVVPRPASTAGLRWVDWVE
ncbi:DUF3293 domain-containing protein [Cognatilysobacter bugurensis]|nr:DUF3293 domain-containing protein [Lysobacter bugurensis]